MRNISFFLTQRQIRNQSKTVTRRQGWKFLKVGDQLQPVEKGQGLKKGEKIKRVGPPIKIISVRQEPLNLVDEAECVSEGFPDWPPKLFVDFYAQHNKCKPDDLVTRIEFEYMPFKYLSREEN